MGEVGGSIPPCPQLFHSPNHARRRKARARTYFLTVVLKTSEAQTVPRKLCKDVIRMVVALLLERRHTFAKKKRGRVLS